MTTNHKEVLTKAFGIMTLEEKGNVRWHLKNKTRVACGKTARHYTTKAGAC